MLSCHIEILSRYFGNVLLNIANGRKVIKILMLNYTTVNYSIPWNFLYLVYKFCRD